MPCCRERASAEPADTCPAARGHRWLSRNSPRIARSGNRFRKPVVYVHGDTHYFRIDKPFLDAQGRRHENFTRVETFGDHQENGTNDVNWVKVRVDASSREVFAFQPQIVPGNRTAVPAP